MKRFFILILIMSLAIQVKAQKIEITDDDIVYFDFEPDTVMRGANINGLYPNAGLDGDYMYVDIDQDGADDIAFYTVSSPAMCNTNPYYPKLRIWRPTDVNMCTFSNDVMLCDTLPDKEFSNTLDYKFDFPAANSCTYIQPDPVPTPIVGNGIWPKHFVGVKRYIDDIDDYCYGWMEISVWYESVNVFYVKLYRMAFCKKPGYPFRAGQTKAVWNGVEENRENIFALHPNPTTGKVQISTDKAIRHVTITNLLGATVLETANPQGNMIDVSSLPAGVYIVRIITTEGKEMFAKLVKR